MYQCLFTDRETKVMFSQRSVILFTGGVYPSMHLGRGLVNEVCGKGGVAKGVW